MPEIGINLVCDLALPKVHVLISNKGELGSKADTYTIKVQADRFAQRINTKP